MEANGELNQIFLLIPDKEELELTLKGPINPDGYDKIIIHEDVIVAFRTSSWYQRLIQTKIPKIFIVRKNRPKLDNNSFGF